MSRKLRVGYASPKGRARVLAKGAKGFVQEAGGVLDLGDCNMTLVTRALAFGRALVLDEAGSSSVRLAVVIGLASSAVLVLVRVAVAMPGLGH